jgi:[acyl-carrier-protein] S-malonyltransferase
VRRYAVLFPGQGSQFVGMGADVFAERPDLLGAGADDTLGWSLATVVAEGPDEELTRTDRAQPALYAVSYALWHVLGRALPAPPGAAAGHSLGEYTALAAAGALDFADGLALVAERGRAMAEAAAASDPSTMVAVMGMDAPAAAKVASDRREQGGKLWVANLNAPGQIVFAGSVADVDWLAEHAADFGARRAIPLNVAGAFHTPYMAPAADRLSAALGEASFVDPEFPVYSNVTAAPMTDPPTQLTEQLTSPVRFTESLQAMAADGIEAFIHVGPGNVTAGLARRSVPAADTYTVSEVADVAGAVDFVQ